MAKKAKFPSQPPPDLIDLSDWLTAKEAIELRQQVGKSMSLAAIYKAADDSKIVERSIKGVRCFARQDVLDYVPAVGRPRLNAD